MFVACKICSLLRYTPGQKSLSAQQEVLEVLLINSKS